MTRETLRGAGLIALWLYFAVDAIQQGVDPGLTRAPFHYPYAEVTLVCLQMAVQIAVLTYILKRTSPLRLVAALAFLVACFLFIDLGLGWGASCQPGHHYVAGKVVIWLFLGVLVGATIEAMLRLARWTCSTVARTRA